MPRRRGGGRPEILARDVLVTSFSARVSLRAEHRRGDEPFIETRSWLELRGKLTEPIGPVGAAVVSMYPEDSVVVGTARPASVGVLLRARPECDFILTWPHQDFDRVWMLALAGRLAHVHLAFTKPHYGKGLVVSASFSSDPPE